MPLPPSSEPASIALAAEAADYSGKSNLALSFLVLPKERRRDMDVFYTFCRVVDDIADSAALPVETKRAWLDGWRKNILRPEGEPQPTRLAMQVRDLMRRHSLPAEHFLEIIAGVEMDLAPPDYATWEDLRRYCHRVASVVGLVSIEIFGCRHDPAACRAYAVDLGLALQLTNILRDVATDYANGGRIYLPRDEMARFGVTAEDIAKGRETPGFLELMRWEAERADVFQDAVIHLAHDFRGYERRAASGSSHGTSASRNHASCGPCWPAGGGTAAPFGARRGGDHPWPGIIYRRTGRQEGRRWGKAGVGAIHRSTKTCEIGRNRPRAFTPASPPVLLSFA